MSNKILIFFRIPAVRRSEFVDRDRDHHRRVDHPSSEGVVAGADADGARQLQGGRPQRKTPQGSPTDSRHPRGKHSPVFGNLNVNNI